MSKRLCYGIDCEEDHCRCHDDDEKTKLLITNLSIRKKLPKSKKTLKKLMKANDKQISENFDKNLRHKTERYPIEADFGTEHLYKK